LTAPFRILVIRLSSLGDVIHALPAAASLKHSFPQSTLTWVVKPRWAPLLEGNPYVDEVLWFERTARGILALRRRLRAETFDLIVDFQGLVQSALVAASARGDKVVGLARTQARESLAALFYSTGVRTTAEHRVDQNLEIATAAGATSLLRTFPMPEGKPEGNLPEGRFVLANPLAGWKWKQWPLQHYGELARRLGEEFGVPLVVNGAPEGADALKSISGALVHLSGLPGLIHATRRTSAVVGVDSGPVHLAAALGRPGVAIYGPTNPASHGPYGGTMAVLRDPSAATSYERRDEENPAMRAVTPQQVFDALKTTLASQPPSVAFARHPG
jgi:heptosyltransferase-1